MKSKLYILAFLFVSCGKHDLQNSSLSVDDGLVINSAAQNQVQAVVMLESEETLCSATIVSKNTVLTAAHCVQANVCIGSVPYQGICPIATYIHDKYVHDTNDPSPTYDIAVLEFAGTPFKSYFELNATIPNISTQVAMVGYAPEKITYRNIDPRKQDPNAQPIKRWGWNQIRSIESNAILTVAKNDFYSAGVSPGDSGGPMFSQCKIIGIASLLGVRWLGSKTGLHNMLGYSEVSTFLRQVESKSSAKFCGFSTTPGEYCNENIAYKALTSTSNDSTFPCEAPLENANQDVTVALASSSDNSTQASVYMSTLPTDGIAGFCINTTPSLCKPGTSLFNEFTDKSNKGSRTIYASSRKIPIQNQQISLVVRSTQDGKLTHGRQVTLTTKQTNLSN